MSTKILARMLAAATFSIGLMTFTASRAAEPAFKKLATKTDEIKAYFQAIKTDTPRTVEIGEYSTLVLSNSVVVFAGMDQFSSTRDGAAHLSTTPGRVRKNIQDDRM